MRQIGPGVGVSFKWQTPTPGQNPDHGGLQLWLHSPAQNHTATSFLRNTILVCSTASADHNASKHHIAANLFRKQCSKFHQNCPSFIENIAKKHSGLFFLDTLYLHIRLQFLLSVLNDGGHVGQKRNWRQSWRTFNTYSSQQTCIQSVLENIVIFSKISQI